MTVREAKKIASALRLVVLQETKLARGTHVAAMLPVVQRNLKQLVLKVQAMGLAPRDVKGDTGTKALAAVARVVFSANVALATVPMESEWRMVLQLAEAELYLSRKRWFAVTLQLAKTRYAKVSNS